MNKLRKTIEKILLILICLTLTGCTNLDDVELRLGMRNKDFEYIKQNKIHQIIIQNVRDKGTKFIINDERTINDFYDILSSAKEVTEKSNLSPDYVFEFYEGTDKVYKFNYISKLSKNEGGNFYSDNKIYYVSKNIDSEVIDNFSDIRSPRYFDQVYYDSILTVIDSFSKKNSNLKIGININDDISISQFLVSVDISKFQQNIEKKYPNVHLMNIQDTTNYDVIMNVKTEGYRQQSGTKPPIYKCIITATTVKDRSEKKYYIVNTLENLKWNIVIYEDKKPSEF